jgi:hypothetical protein
MAESVRQSLHRARLFSNLLDGNEGQMRVSALRIAAGAGLLLCGLMLGSSGAWRASAEPGEGDHGRTRAESSKGVNISRPSLSSVIGRIVSEHRAHAGGLVRTAPRAAIGSRPDREAKTSEAQATTQAGTRASLEAGDPDQFDNTVVASTGGGTQSPKSPFPLFLLERGERWTADRVVSRLNTAIEPFVALIQPPDPQPSPGPAFRGPAPQAPAPEPVLDASGGVAGGRGGGVGATGFGTAPVISAPVVAVPLPPPAAMPIAPPAAVPIAPPAAVRLPGSPSAPAPAVAPAPARGPIAEPAMTASAIRPAGAPPESRALGSTGGRATSSGYTDYLRRPGLPQLAGAALPGVAGILLMTYAGVAVGHRQAKAGRMIRSSAAARYLP